MCLLYFYGLFKLTRTDARGVKSHFSYNLPGGGLDPLNRVHERTYDLTGPLQSGLPIHAAPKVTYEYMTTGDKTRIKKIRTDGWLTEDYTYDGQARVSTYKQTVDNQESYPMETGYLYDTLNRVTEVHYPAQYGLSGNPRKVVANSYDTASRLTQLTYNGDVQASDIIYNAAGQTTEIKVGEAGTNQVTEEYTFDSQTGLLTNQKAVKNGTTTMLDLSYGYSRLGSVGSLNGKTGHLTSITDNLDTDKNREYEYDALGRLTKAIGGKSAIWDQTYTYDRYGNRTNVAATGTAADSSPIPIDGIPGLAYDNTTNRITTSGFEYDAAGNQIRALAENGVDWLLYEYDAANRLRVIKKDDTTPLNIEAYYYGSSNSRLLTHNTISGAIITYASAGGTTLTEYTEYPWASKIWTKSHTYFGGRLLGTITPDGLGGEYVELNHPDRLGTRLITNQAGGTSYEQVTLPFGTALNAESTVTTNNRRFTSYDRSSATGLDYAVNRIYDSKQGRFTQVDPIGMNAVNLEDPQTLNLYNYCGNDPINHTDPSGLFWKSLKKFFKVLLKILVAAVLIVAAYFAFKFGIGFIFGKSLVSKLVGGLLLAGGTVAATKALSIIVSSVRELIYKCNVPNFDGLSEERQQELRRRGVSSGQWDRLKNKQRLGYFNIVAAIASAGLSLTGWLVDWAGGGIDQDRVFFLATVGAVNIYHRVAFSNQFYRSNGHGPSHPIGFRHKSLISSLQLTFSGDGRRIDADIDYFSWGRNFFISFGHAFEVIGHAVGHVLGGTKTNPYNMVRYRSSWECE